MRIKKFSLISMSALKSYFPPGFIRNVWHLFLLISAFFASALTIVDIMFIPDLEFVSSFFFLFLIVGLVAFPFLALSFLWKATGIVGYWASFLWFGLFFLFTGIIMVPESCSIVYQLFCLLGNILLLVFFWNLGNLDRRILALLFLLFTPLSVIMFSPEPAWNITEVHLKFWLIIAFIVYFVFYSLFAIMAVNSAKLLKLPGFRCLFVGFSFFLFVVLLVTLYDSYIANNLLLFLPPILILTLSSPVLVIIGASVFTLKMDPLELEKRLRKATPAKEVESADQKV